MNKTEYDKRNQQYCSRCFAVVGCDHTGKKHKCTCGGSRKKKVKVT